MAKWGLLGLLTMAGIFLLGNVQNAFIAVAPDRIGVAIAQSVALSDISSKLEGSRVYDVKTGQLSVPYGQAGSYIKQAFSMKGVFRAGYIPLDKPEISLKYYFFTLRQQIVGYAHGDFGTIMTGSGRTVLQVSEVMKDLVPRTFRYFIPGLLTAVALALALSLLASTRKWMGNALDGIHAVLVSVPDFFFVTLMTFAAIFVYKHMKIRLALVAQFGDQVPFLIPYLTIALIPSVMIYGTMRLAIQRELSQPYVVTARAKGLSRGAVLLFHVLRNVVEDLLAVLPKATTAALASMAIAEASCDILGLGGIIVSPRMQGFSVLPLACLALAVISMLFHGFYALLRKFFVVRTREAA